MWLLSKVLRACHALLTFRLETTRRRRFSVPNPYGWTSSTVAPRVCAMHKRLAALEASKRLTVAQIMLTSRPVAPQCRVCVVQPVDATLPYISMMRMR